MVILDALLAYERVLLLIVCNGLPDKVYKHVSTFPLSLMGRLGILGNHCCHLAMFSNCSSVF